LKGAAAQASSTSLGWTTAKHKQKTCECVQQGAAGCSVVPWVGLPGFIRVARVSWMPYCNADRRCILPCLVNFVQRGLRFNCTLGAQAAEYQLVTLVFSAASAAAGVVCPAGCLSVMACVWCVTPCR
jgi:hypothetical protein